MDTKISALRIGIVLDTSLDPDDGVQQYVINIGEWLRTQGHDVHYLVGQTETRSLPNIHSLAKNMTVKFNGNRTTIPLPTSKKKLSKFLRDNHFDVLHVQIPHSPFMAQKLVLSADIKTAVIGTFHILPYGLLSNVGNYGLGMWLKPSLRRFDKILAVSPAAANFASKSFKIQPEVLPNVINFKEFNSAKPFSNYKDGKINILFLGRLVPRKGCLQLLKAVAYLQSNNNDLKPYRVIVCGKGPLEAKLKNFVKTHDLENIVEFIGYVSEKDKPRYYASADISVFPSSGGESFGIVLLEAMAGGTSVVLAGDNPGYRSVMGVQSSLLFEPNNVEDLAFKIKHYIDSEFDRDKMSKWGSNYTKDFDINVVGQQLTAIYNEALRKRRAL